MEKYIDLHTHSIKSDGSMTPAEVVREAKKAGLSAIALSDHDTVDGVKEAMEEGKRIGVEVVPAIEFSVQSATETHILAYYLDIDSPLLKETLDKVNETRNFRMSECCRKLNELGGKNGIGIIDIRAMYGIGAVAQSKSIDLVIHMEKWVEGKEYDRLGLNDEYITILGVKVPSQTMPVRPGRNLAIIIEVAARNLSMKKLGFSAARELDRRMNEMIMKRSNPDAQNQD